MKKLQKPVVFIFLIITMFTSPLWSGTTGKIAGIVIDEETSTGEILGKMILGNIEESSESILACRLAGQIHETSA